MEFPYEPSDPGSGNRSLSFIPSLGLAMKTEPSSEWEQPEAGSFAGKVAELANKTWLVEAGTDCIGFAQRAATYNGSGYAWSQLGSAWTETGNGSGCLNIWDVMTTERANTREYPRFSTDADGPKNMSFEIWTRTTHNFNEIIQNANEYIDDQNKIKRIVPGDVFYWYYRVNGTPHAHIALVSSIEWTDDSRVKDIVLIESTFGRDANQRYTQQVRKTENLTTQYQYLLDKFPHYHLVRLSK